MESHLAQVKLQYITDVMWWGLWQLHQLFAVLKRLAQLLHPRLHPIHSINALRERGGGGDALIKILHFYWPRPAESDLSLAYLHSQSPSLDLSDALLDDEGDPVGTVAGHLWEILPEQLKATLEFLVATLNGQSLQAAFVTSQETLQRGNQTLITLVYFKQKDKLYKT